MHDQKQTGVPEQPAPSGSLSFRAWGLESVICCDVEYAVANDDDRALLGARELGDGSVCLTCPSCGGDIAVTRMLWEIDELVAAASAFAVMPITTSDVHAARVLRLQAAIAEVARA